MVKDILHKYDMVNVGDLLRPLCKVENETANHLFCIAHGLSLCGWCVWLGGMLLVALVLRLSIGWRVGLVFAQI